MKQGKDARLRQAIQRILNQINSTESKSKLYQHALNELCELSASPFGFILEKEVSEDGYTSLVCTSNFGPGFNTQREKTHDCRIPVNAELSDFYRAISNDQPFVLINNHLRSINKACKNWPMLKQAIALTLGDDENFCVICLANAVTPYHIDFAERIWPFLSICVSLLRTLHRRQPEQHSTQANTEPDSWRRQFSELETIAPIGVVAIDQDHRIVRINPSAEIMFGVNPKTIEGLDISTLIPELSDTEHANNTFHPLPSDNIKAIGVKGRHSNGERFPLELTAMHYRERNQPCLLLLLRDRTELQKMLAQHQVELERFRTLSDLAPMGILQTDEHWQTRYVNNRWLEVTGRSEDDIQGLNWGNALYHEDADATLTELHACLAAGLEFRCECRIQRSIAEIIWVQLHARPIYNCMGNVDGFLATLIDNSYYHQAEEKLRHLAERDALTGLANRVFFMDRLEHALDRIDRHGSLALLALDLDGFKNINDSLGHDAGDQLLIEVSKRLTKCVRNEDTVSRVGGDEFIILLEDLKQASVAAQVSEKVLEALQKPVFISHQEVFISTSIGICFAVDGGRASAKILLKQADMALYRAKDAGRNNYQYYSPELELASRRRLELGNSLHHALSRAEFEIYYQAQANVSNNKITGFEALLRWQHPHRGLLPPFEFIPLLEETGLITTVSRWMFHISLHKLKEWINCGLVTPDTAMSLNISPCQFRDPLLLSSIKGALKDSGLEGSNLVVEMTETAMLQEHHQTIECLVKLQKMGVGIALDDFGTGYSSLSYLKKFPIDTIKIDRSFIKDVLVDKEDATITQGVLALAKSLHMKVVAEGVDAPAILELLKQWRCEVYQGYLLNKPMPSDELEKFLADRNSESPPSALRKTNDF